MIIPKMNKILSNEMKDDIDCTHLCWTDLSEICYAVAVMISPRIIDLSVVKAIDTDFV